MRVGSATYIVSSSAQIDPGVIVDSDVNAAAAIKFSKLNSGAINTDLIPDGQATRSLGDLPHRLAYAYITYLYAMVLTSDIRPYFDDTYSIGNITYGIKEMFVHKISGNAAGQIMVNGLLGGLT